MAQKREKAKSKNTLWWERDATNRGDGDKFLKAFVQLHRHALQQGIRACNAQGKQWQR